MNVQCFIPDWPGPKQHAGDLAAIISTRYPVTVLGNPNDYFNAQWENARAEFTGDVFLWVMADVTLPADFTGMCNEMERIMKRGDVGIYAPNVAWTSYIYNKRTLRNVERGYIYEVPNTDSLCFAVRGDVIRAMPYVNPKLSFMWGADLTTIATARLMGLKTVRDYRFKAEHPNSTGYNIERAGQEMIPLFKTYPQELQNEIARLEEEVRRLRVNP